MAFEAGDREAVEGYFSAVLGNSAYPEGFPQGAKVAFVSESRQLVVEYDLPEMDAVIPTAKGYAYVKTGDRVNESARPEKQRRSMYAAVVARTALRCLHELFAADLHPGVVIATHVQHLVTLALFPLVADAIGPITISSIFVFTRTACFG